MVWLIHQDCPITIGPKLHIILVYVSVFFLSFELEEVLLINHVLIFLDLHVRLTSLKFASR